MQQQRNPKLAARGSGKSFSAHYSNLNAQKVKDAAVGRWYAILVRLGVDSASLTGKHSPCPICGGKDRFRYDNREGRGTFICNGCGSGDGWTLLMRLHNWNFTQAVEAVAGTFGLDSEVTVLPPKQAEPTVSPFQSERNKKRLSRYYKGSKWTTEIDVVGKYLHSRIPGLDEQVFRNKVLRTHERLPYFRTSGQQPILMGKFNALLAIVSAPCGKPITMHRLWLDKFGRKLKLIDPEQFGAYLPSRKLLPPEIEGAARGGAIRLFPCGPVLGVAEGLETALACYTATKIPTWATISAAGMASLVVPADVTEVVIFADNDENSAGLKAARKLASRLIAEGRTVRIVMPDFVGTDFADEYLGEFDETSS